jgi:hypothetical protein
MCSRDGCATKLIPDLCSARVRVLDEPAPTLNLTPALYLPLFLTLGGS